MGLQIVTRNRYLGVLVRDGAAEKIWLTEKVEGWAESMRTLSGVARKHPHSAYSGLKNSLQQEW